LKFAFHFIIMVAAAAWLTRHVRSQSHEHLCS